MRTLIKHFKIFISDIIKRIKVISYLLFVCTPKNLLGTFKGLFIEDSTEDHSSVYNTTKNIIIALTIAILIRSFLYEPFHIPSGSMKPGLMEGDYIFVSKYTYGYSRYSFPFGKYIKYFSDRINFKNNIKRGEVVVFRLPANPSINYIKRVVGLPNDKIQVKDGVLYINEKAISKRYVNDVLEYENDNNTKVKSYEEVINNNHFVVLDRTPYSNGDNTEVYIVPKNNYFFMGDNRDNSLDSRFPQTGFVPKENIIGQAKLIFLSSRDNPLKFWKWKSIIRWNRIFKKIK